MYIRQCFVVLCCFLVRTFIGGFWPALGLYFIALQDYFSANVTQASLIGSVCTTILWTTAIVASALSHRLSFRVIVITGGAITTTSLIVAALLADSVHQVALAFGFTGFGLGLALLSTQAVLVFNFDKRLGTAVSLANSGVGIGLFVIPPLIQVLLERLGWRDGTLILAAIYANICVCGAVLLPTESEIEIRRQHARHHKNENNKPTDDNEYDMTEAKKRTTKDSSEDNFDATNSKDQSGKCATKTKTENSRISGPVYRTFTKFIKSLDLKLFYTNPSFVGFFLCGLFIGLGYSSILYIAPKAVDGGMTKLNASYLISIVGIGSILGRLLAGCIADRQQTLSSSVICGIFTVLSGITIFLYPIHNNFGFMACVSFVFGVVSGVFNCLHLLVGKEYVGANKTSGAFAWFQFAWAYGSFAGIYLQAHLYDVTGNYLASFAVGGSFICLSGLCLLIGPCIKTAERLVNRKHERIGREDKVDSGIKSHHIVKRRNDYDEMI